MWAADVVVKVWIASIFKSVFWWKTGILNLIIINMIARPPFALFFCIFCFDIKIEC